ncbi:MAG: Rpn family recombination-promoting nuclease/putative transposase [Bacteroidales bacterium]|nr:Rpn family recombination-promoting nuclease/putative transposase [Bacteroidales bacterium]
MKNTQQLNISTGNVFIDLRLDYAFKLTFGKRGNEDLLLKLIDAILPHLGITHVSLANQEEVGGRADARKATLDVHCTTGTGREILIEMQCAEQHDFGERMVFYSTFPVQNGVVRGKTGPGAYTFPDIYVIGITDFVMMGTKSIPDPINHYSIRNEKYAEVGLTGNIHYVTVELPKLMLPATPTAGDLILCGIRDIGAMKEMPTAFRDAGLEKLFEICRFAKLKKQEQMEYLQEFMKKLNEKSVLETAKMRGHEEGFAEGRTEGRAKGRAEERLNVARNLKNLCVQEETIVQATGLTAEEVSAL